jgi:hypothetical protein
MVGNLRPVRSSHDEPPQLEPSLMVDRSAARRERRFKVGLATASLTALLCMSAASGISLAVSSVRPPAPPPATRTQVTGDISSDTTWNRAGSPYLITGQLTVRAATTLTIEPGVEVRFGQGGQLSVNGSLIAAGVAEQRIRFVGVDDRPGSWRGISLEGSPAAPATGTFAFVTILGGGAGGFRGQLYVYSAVVEMRESEVRDGSGDGVVVDSGSLTLTDTQLTGNAGLPVHVRSLTGLASIAAVDPVLRNLTIQGNGVDAIAIDGGNISLDSTWEKAGAPYLVGGQVFVHAPATLTVEPGVEVRFTPAGTLGIEGGLVAMGTEALPIRLVGTSGTAGAWRGIRLLGRGTEPARATLAHVTLANGGNAGVAAIDVFNGRLSFTDGEIVNHAADGILFSGGAVGGLVEGSAITDIGGVGLANTTDQLIVAPNNWWGSPTGPTTNDACYAGNGTRLQGLVRFGPWLTSAEQRPDPLAPLEIPLVTLSPQRWYAPADGKTRVWVDVSLLDPRGHPIPGATVILVSSLGDVTSGGITDAAGHTLAYLTSTEMGDAELTAALSTADRCDQAASTTAMVTFTDEADGLLAGMQAPYLYDGITIAPEPITRGVPTTITARLNNPNDAPIRVEATFEFVQSGIGLAFGPVGQPQVKEIAAHGEQVFETTWTPVVSGHYCVQVLYRVVDGEGPTPTLGAVAAANGPGFPAPVRTLVGGGGGSGQRNLNVYGGGLGPGGPPSGKPGGKPPLDKAKNAGDAVGKMGKFAGGATLIPRAAVGVLTGWQFKQAAEISKGLGGDPPRQDFTIIAEPVRTPLPAVARMAGVSDEQFAAEVKLAEAMAELIAVGDAAIISFDRYGGAASANDLEWASVQAASLLHYRKLYGEASIVAADRMAALRAVIDREGGADVGLTRQQASDALAEIRASGFSREQIDAAHALGLTDEAIEADRQALLNTNPDDLAGSFVAKLADAELAFREMGDYLVAPVNFTDEPGATAGANGGLIAVAEAAGEDSNLARIYTHTSTIQVGNPLDHEATVDLRVRRLSMPVEWPVDLSPASVVLGPGEEATVTVTISATTPWPQGTRSDVAIEGFSEGQLLGGVVVALLVPRSVPFGVLPGGGPPLLVIAIAAGAVALILLAVFGFLVLRRHRRSTATVGRPTRQ